MSALDLIAKAAKGVKNAPFFSKVDEVLDSLPRNKGTGDEFLREIEKTKGVKPAEIQDRGIAKALKGKPKMTKAEVQKIFESNPPPRVQEKVLSGETPDWEEFLDAKAQEEFGADWFDLSKQEKAEIEQMYKELPTTQYDQYKTPGGENYREILLKLPKRGLTKMEQGELMQYESDLRRGAQFIPERQARYNELKAKEPAGSTNYTSGHYKEDPNLLAHIRVQDFQVPSKGFAVVNTKSGNRSQVFPTVQEAHAFMFQMPEHLRGMLKITGAQGKPKKVLLVDEIQSDWHQAGRKGGYSNKYKPEDLSPYSKEQAQSEFGLDNADLFWYLKTPDQVFQIPKSRFDSMDAAAQYVLSEKTTAGAVPDAPFKKNWHELAMKRVLDYAAENGYDSIAITPGAEQAKRYDLSKQVDELLYKKNPDGTYQLSAQAGGRGNMMGEAIPAEKLEDYVGKEVAEKIISNKGIEQNLGGPGSVSQPKDVWGSLSGLDLQVGGEGMKGFYDKILPDYLNNFGKQYGSQMGEMQIEVGSDMGRGPNDEFLGRVPIYTNVHSFDITPQMREQIQTKGQPMYGKVATPALEGLAAGTGAATIGSEVFDTNNEQQVQNPVHFTENPDAMLLELMQRN
jgi:hypothetical protein